MYAISLYESVHLGHDMSFGSLSDMRYVSSP